MKSPINALVYVFGKDYPQIRGIKCVKIHKMTPRPPGGRKILVKLDLEIKDFFDDKIINANILCHIKKSPPPLWNAYIYDDKGIYVIGALKFIKKGNK